MRQGEQALLEVGIIHSRAATAVIDASRPNSTPDRSSTVPAQRSNCICRSSAARNPVASHDPSRLGG
ncbi:hypothetical protein [Streptomyces sp. NPDC053069]|uniref:hypothetical protein n=1 Tax=Streptomyces sp. NPDC053069 TaxID=3365695 RepID=UPI0037CF6100